MSTPAIDAIAPLAGKRDAALEAARRGFSVFPVVPNAKVPAIKNWQNLATTDRTKIRAMWREQPDANIGISTACLLVVDVDLKKGGEASALNLDNEWGLPPTLCSRTWSGGSHMIYALPDHVFVSNSVGTIAPGIDIRSWGGLIVAPGSTIDGKYYEWLNERSPTLAPQWLIDRCKTARAKRANAGKRVAEETEEGNAQAFDYMVKHAVPVDEGERDISAYKMAAALFDFAVSSATCLEYLIEWNVAMCNPPFDADTLAVKVDSASRNRQNTIGSRRPTNSGFEPYEMPEASTAVSRIESRGLKLNKSNKARDTFENALCAVTQADIAPAWNELRQGYVFRAPELPWLEKYGRVLDDHTLRLVRLYLMNKFQGVGYAPRKDHLLEAIKTVAYGAMFNPVIEYLDTLRWDGVKRVARLFPQYFNCEDDEYTRGVSHCFMVGAVRRMRRPGCKFDTMPILQSPQGWGKSTAIRTLFGLDYYSDAELGNLRDKDSAMKLRGVWVQEFAEMESLSRAETGVLKAFCSRATDRQRDPYAVTVSDVPRRCVFIATVNEGGYLKDTTGARRFWPLTVGARIDIKLLAGVRDQLWAEAAALEAQGVSDVLPSALWPAAAERQTEQTSDDPWADTLRDNLDRQDDSRPLPFNRVHTSALLFTLGISIADRTKDKSQRLRTVMASLGWRYRQSVRADDKVSTGYVRDDDPSAINDAACSTIVTPGRAPSTMQDLM